MKALSITFKDLKIMFKDRGILLQLFLLPLLFVLIFSGALSAIGGEEPDTRVPLAVVDLDGGASAAEFLDKLDAAGGVRVERYDESEATTLLEENDISRVLTIPAGFTAAVESGQPVTLRLVSHPEASPQQTEAVRLVIDGVASDISLEIQLFAALQHMAEMQADAADTSQAFGLEAMQAQARGQFEAAQTEPLVEVIQKVPGQDEEKEEPLSVADIAVPGATVLFVFMTAQTVARSIYDEKKIGSFRRLLAAPVPRPVLILGKMMPNFVTGLIQSVVIFLFGIFGLELMGLTPVTMGNEPLATVLVVIVLAFCSSAFGILIAAFARTEGQIGGLSNLLLWVLGILGGSIIPVFLLEQFLGPVLYVVPHYWANRALLDLMVRGRGLVDVILEIAVLLGFTALFFVVGTWRFEFE
ncbi:MAG: ABC transporter permease [Anaerolineae bacterium]|jgi:ABC-2 type transport system permease protein